MRELQVGNGSLLVNFDDKYHIRDIYFPHAGQENHTEGAASRFGIWTDGVFSAISDDAWSRDLRYVDGALVTDVTLRNESVGIEIKCNDTVAVQENVFLRRVEVRDLWGHKRDARVFLHHDLRIYENKVGDAAFYDPESKSLIHYKKHRWFLINTEPHFDQFVTGRKAFRDQDGTWADAADGRLDGSVITEGSVDSTIGVNLNVPANGTASFYYWIVAGTDYDSVTAENARINRHGAEEFFAEEHKESSEWLALHTTDLSVLPENLRRLFERSLLIIRSNTDNDGAMIAANDSDVSERATDHYSYMWPRDGAFVANSFGLAGYPEIAEKFFEFCRKIPHRTGCYLQKYNPDGSYGSSWHPHWDRYSQTRMLPIQEDETSLVVWSIGEHYNNIFPDRQIPRELYDEVIVACADFLVRARDESTGLPKPTWNLWEDRRGVHTFTCATIVGALRHAAVFAEQFGDNERARLYADTAETMLAAMGDLLFSREHNRFLRSIQWEADGTTFPDTTVDASLFAVFYFKCLLPDDPRVVSTMAAVGSHLSNPLGSGGIGRFEDDGYMRGTPYGPGNPWVICTLWLAEYFIARSRSTADLAGVLDLLNWTSSVALPSGVLAEQIDPVTGGPLSVSPLTWSHSTFVTTTINYLRRLAQLTNDGGS